jgi:hypothetical protein
MGSPDHERQRENPFSMPEPIDFEQMARFVPGKPSTNIRSARVMPLARVITELRL